MGAWPALTYELPALAQRVLGETFFAEAVFTVGLLAFALALTARTATELSGRASAVVATIATLFASTKLYGYSKVLVFAVAAALFVRYVRQPTRARAAHLAVWSAVAFLFRHDFLVYLAAAGRDPDAAGNAALARGVRSAADLRGHGRAAARRSCLLGSALRRYRFVSRNGPRARRSGGQPHDVPLAAVRACDRAASGRSCREEGNAVAWLYDVSVAIPIVALLVLIGSPRAQESRHPTNPRRDRQPGRARLDPRSLLLAEQLRRQIRRSGRSRRHPRGLAAVTVSGRRAVAAWVGVDDGALVLVPTMMALVHHGQRVARARHDRTRATASRRSAGGSRP